VVARAFFQDRGWPRGTFMVVEMGEFVSDMRVGVMKRFDGCWDMLYVEDGVG
jgi:hypothetical protein